MFIDQLVDSFNGDESSKEELRKAFKKSLKVKLILFFGLSAIAFPLTYIIFSSLMPNDHSTFVRFSTIVMTCGFSLVFPGVISLILGNLSMNIFTRHLKITLPETIAPKIEIRSR